MEKKDIVLICNFDRLSSGERSKVKQLTKRLEKTNSVRILGNLRLLPAIFTGTNAIVANLNHKHRADLASLAETASFFRKYHPQPERRFLSIGRYTPLGYTRIKNIQELVEKIK